MCVCVGLLCCRGRVATKPQKKTKRNTFALEKKIKVFLIGMTRHQVLDPHFDAN